MWRSYLKYGLTAHHYLTNKIQDKLLRLNQHLINRPRNFIGLSAYLLTFSPSSGMTELETIHELAGIKYHLFFIN